MESIVTKFQIAVLLTCHNRVKKTLACLASLSNCTLPNSYSLKVYLVDDGSTDGTSSAIKVQFPSIRIITSNGNLYWAGGMRLAWNTALQNGDFDAFFLLNDDVILDKNSLLNLIHTHQHSIIKTGQSGIYVGTTAENVKRKISYGGHLITKNHFLMRSKMVIPMEYPQICHFANANILWVSKDVVKKIGIVSSKYTHAIADYDYTLTARKQKIPLWVAPGICGLCDYDHGNNWLSSNVPLKNRISYLKSKKGLAYNEYLYFIQKHFPLYYPYSIIMLWKKTLFPIFWDISKK